MSDDLQITFSFGSDVGKVRDHNEDWVAVHDPPVLEMKRKGRLFTVADGMGGYLAGEVASKLAVETVQREYYADPSEDPATRLRNAVQAANSLVYMSAHSDSSHAGMGTTIVTTALVGRKAYIASVGDSRAYVVHRGQLSQITQDHSFVGEQIRAGLLTKEQARVHPQRNVITRALGSQPTVQVDSFEGDLSNGDVLLLCTDGLTGHVPEERIRDLLMQLPPKEAVQRLIEAANEGGGTDNISAIVLRVGPLPSGTAQVIATAAPRDKVTQTFAAQATTQPSPAPSSKAAKGGISLVWIVGAAIVLVGAIALGALALLAGDVLLGDNKKTTPTAAPNLAASSTAAGAQTVTPLATFALPTATSAPAVLPSSTLIPTPLPTLTPLPSHTPKPTVSSTLTLSPTLTLTSTVAATEKPEKDTPEPKR